MPDVVAVRSLAYIRSQMLEKEENSTSIQIQMELLRHWLKSLAYEKKGAEIHVRIRSHT